MLRHDLPPLLRHDLRTDLRRDLRRDLKEDLHFDLRHGLRNDLRQDLRPGLHEDLRHGLRNDLRRDLAPNLHIELRQDLHRGCPDEGPSVRRAVVPAIRRNFVAGPQGLRSTARQESHRPQIAPIQVDVDVGDVSAADDWVRCFEAAERRVQLSAI